MGLISWVVNSKLMYVILPLPLDKMLLRRERMVVFILISNLFSLLSFQQACSHKVNQNIKEVYPVFLLSMLMLFYLVVEKV